MPMQQLDVIVRVAAATLLLVAAAAGRSTRGAAGRYFTPLALCLCGLLAGNSSDPDLRLGGPLAYPAVLLAGYAALCLWWYCLAVFDHTFRPRGAVLWVGVTWLLLSSADRRLFGSALAEAELSHGLVLLGVGMVAHLGWRLLQDRDGDLLDSRRRTRRITALALAGQLGADLGIDLVMGFDWQPPALPILQNTILLAFVAWLLVVEMRTHAAVATAPCLQRGTSASASAEGGSDIPALQVPAEDPTMARLRTLMEVERLFLDPDLTFARFTRAVGASERSVRRLIHEQLGHEHFRTFLNGYRVAEAQRLLGDPARRHDKLTAIAFASGFASLPTFNRVFKEIAGLSPSEFRAGTRRAPPRRCRQNEGPPRRSPVSSSRPDAVCDMSASF
jgi:AraC-like DNA-binding protein